jgi:hypothetical protein
MSRKQKPVGWKSCVQLSYFRDAWRAVTWTRKLVWPLPLSSSSFNFWHQTSDAHVADIKKGPILRPEDGGATPLLAFRELYSAFPILSLEDGDVIYLKSLREPSDMHGWVAALDIGNKALKVIGKYYLPDDDFSSNQHYDPNQPFHASTLSRHLDITPGMPSPYVLISYLLLLTSLFVCVLIAPASFVCWFPKKIGIGIAYEFSGFCRH